MHCVYVRPYLHEGTYVHMLTCFCVYMCVYHMYANMLVYWWSCIHVYVYAYNMYMADMHIYLCINICFLLPTCLCICMCEYCI